MLLEEDDAALESRLDELAPLSPGRVLDLTGLAGQPRALWRRALHRWLRVQPKAGEISRQAFDALLDALEHGRSTRHSLGVQGFAVTDGRRLRFETAKKSAGSFRRRAN